MPEDLLRALIDPTAPLPGGWPSGALGAFCLFLLPVGGGIPLGVLMARNAGVTPLTMVGMYLAADLIRAVTREPLLILLRFLSRHIPLLATAGTLMSRSARFAGLDEEGPQGPLGIVTISFVIDPTIGRAAAAAAGHGFISGWTLAIIGDMLFFVLLMVSTLWASSVLGDDRLTVGIVLVATFILPLVVKRLRRKRAPGPPVRMVRVTEPSQQLQPARGRVHHDGRRRASRGVRR